jgi:hypothetical protein
MQKGSSTAKIVFLHVNVLQRLMSVKKGIRKKTPGSKKWKLTILFTFWYLQLIRRVIEEV